MKVIFRQLYSIYFRVVPFVVLAFQSIQWLSICYNFFMNFNYEWIIVGLLQDYLFVSVQEHFAIERSNYMNFLRRSVGVFRYLMVKNWIGKEKKNSMNNSGKESF